MSVSSGARAATSYADGTNVAEALGAQSFAQEVSSAMEPKIISFRCRRFRFDDSVEIVFVERVADIVSHTDASLPTILLIGEDVSEIDARNVIQIASRHGCYFLRVRAGDREKWIRRLVQQALR